MCGLCVKNNLIFRPFFTIMLSEWYMWMYCADVLECLQINLLLKEHLPRPWLFTCSSVTFYPDWWIVIMVCLILLYPGSSGKPTRYYMSWGSFVRMSMPMLRIYILRARGIISLTVIRLAYKKEWSLQQWYDWLARWNDFSRSNTIGLQEGMISPAVIRLACKKEWFLPQ